MAATQRLAKPFRVELTPPEERRAQEVGLLRQHEKERLASTRNYSKKPTSLEIHVMGVRGEIALARYLDCPFDDSLRRDGDGGTDFVYEGRRIDAQTTQYNPPHLKYYPDHKFRADIAVLMENPGEGTVINVWGWVSRVRFEMLARIRDYNHGPRLSVTEKDLNPMDMLKEYCAKVRSAP